jgi:hypothetical protein
MVTCYKLPMQRKLSTINSRETMALLGLPPCHTLLSKTLQKSVVCWYHYSTMVSVTLLRSRSIGTNVDGASGFPKYKQKLLSISTMHKLPCTRSAASTLSTT